MEDIEGVIPQNNTKSPIRQIESPKYALGLSVIDKFMNLHSPNSPSYQLSPTG